VPLIVYHKFKEGNRDDGHVRAIEAVFEILPEGKRIVRCFTDTMRGGEMENIIKELKIGFGAEYMPFGDFGANAFWFGLQVLSYNIFVMLREEILPWDCRRRRIEMVKWVGVKGGVSRVFIWGG
jgi:hypothetical protein